MPGKSIAKKGRNNVMRPILWMREECGVAKSSDEVLLNHLVYHIDGVIDA